MSENCTHDCSSCSANCSSRKPESLLAEPHKGSHIKKVIGVVSGKGGVGKSMVTALMAVGARRLGLSTAILDADITGPSIPKAFGIREKAMGSDDGIFPVETKTGIKAMSLNLLLENDTDPVVWRGPIIAGTVKQFWTDVIWGDCDIMDQEYAMYGGKDKAKGTVDRNESLFKGVWQIYLNEALEMAGYQSLRDIPRNITQPAQMLLAALLITADWLASNTAFCPLIAADTLLNKNLYPARSTRAISMIDLPKPWQLNDEWRYYDLCSARFGFEQPNAIQTEIQRIAAETQNPGIIILEAPMGMGKTEAALAASEILAERLGERGLAFFLPSQATANCMFRRVTRWTSRFAQWKRLSVELAHGKAMFNDEFARLVENANSVDDEPDAGACDKSEQKGRNSQTDEYDASSNADDQSGLMAHTFFLGRKTQLLADFVVGTVDQLLMGALKQKHIMLRHLGLAGKVVVIDEVHAYDSLAGWARTIRQLYCCQPHCRASGVRRWWARI